MTDELAVAEGTVVARLDGAHLDDVPLGDFSAALGQGKVEPLGADLNYGPQPTLFDPASGSWDDAGWMAHSWLPGGLTGSRTRWSSRDGAYGYSDIEFARNTVASPHNIAQIELFIYSTAQTEFIDTYTFSRIDEDGTNRRGGFACENDRGGSILVQLRDAYVKFVATAQPSQTEPLLDLQDENGNGILQVAPDGSVGGVAPNTGDVLQWDGTNIVWGTP